MQIQKAVRRKAKFLGCLYGFSGSGKTYSALRLAKGLGKKIGLIDTENTRALMYGDDFDFFHIDLKPPFTPERIFEAVDDLDKFGCDVIIIDSISHEWMGLGGCIEMAENATTRSGKPRQGLDKWNRPISRHRKLINKLGQVNRHLIFCARAKEVYIQDPKTNKISKEGFCIVQHKEFNHEMLITFYMNNKHAVLEKCHKDLVKNLEIKNNEYLSEKHGQAIAKWLDGGIDIEELNIDDLKSDMFDVAEKHGTKQLRGWLINKTQKERDLLKPFYDEVGKIALKFDNKGSKTGGLDDLNNNNNNEVENG